ncbi:hypothetical protein AX774_g2561 [Zancudomyces culisetae]|uniref:Uncharacterized protein n=1 Tax=Zancudomyces culisetae TaxID=1213189 RepID=A0A1R1PSI1_ZANCU|nr:hypothetical protein AX774_g2561 [Zancudomyces culisetae]|eukprot:OMH83927.1 hypothetical protein AX774_g2561 [Zancudomyces culisetae]
MVKITLAGVSIACAMLSTSATPVPGSAVDANFNVQPPILTPQNYELGQYANPVANGYRNAHMRAAVAAGGMTGLPLGTQRAMTQNARAVALADRGLMGNFLGNIGNGIDNTINTGVSAVVGASNLIGGAINNSVNGAIDNSLKNAKLMSCLIDSGLGNSEAVAKLIAELEKVRNR